MAGLLLLAAACGGGGPDADEVVARAQLRAADLGPEWRLILDERPPEGGGEGQVEACLEDAGVSVDDLEPEAESNHRTFERTGQRLKSSVQVLPDASRAAEAVELVASDSFAACYGGLLDESGVGDFDGLDVEEDVVEGADRSVRVLGPFTVEAEGAVVDAGFGLVLAARGGTLVTVSATWTGDAVAGGLLDRAARVLADRANT